MRNWTESNIIEIIKDELRRINNVSKTINTTSKYIEGMDGRTYKGTGEKSDK